MNETSPALGLLLAAALFATGCQRRPAAAPGSRANASGQYVMPLQAPVALAGPVGDVAELVDRLRPTVVNITTTQTTREQPEGLPFFFRQAPGGPRKAMAQGTGFIVDPRGYVVTNAHVVSGAEDIQVRLSDDREFAAKLVGKDTKLDLALLRIDGANNLAAVVLGDSDALRVGEWVLAIGNPFGLGHTVTIGITSAKDRTIGAGPYDAFIQTDASINPGNSGGPLFNLKGEVVGIPTAIRQGAQGIGFAVPVNALKDVLPQLRDKGTVTRGKLGVRIQHVTTELARSFGLDRARGALVSNLEKGGAAARAGIKEGDIITRVEGAEVLRSEDLPRLVARHAPGSSITLTLVRGGHEASIQAVLDALVDESDEEESDEQPRPAAPSTQPQSRLGVKVDDAPNGEGARVRVVAPNSLASGQLTPGDVIVEVNRQPVRTAADLIKQTDGIKNGEVLLLKVRRGVEQRFVAITIK